MQRAHEAHFPEEREIMMIGILLNRKAVATLVLLLICATPASAQLDRTDRYRWFIGYEIFEMAMNRFQNFAGELGYRFSPRYQLRLTIMEVNLTERHLSSSWEAYAVDGENVEGYFRGYEANLDRFVWKHLYVSGSLGYYADTYEHTELPDRVENNTITLGTGVGYMGEKPFGISHLFINFSMPFRYYFDQIEKTKLGTTTIREHVIISNMWLFVGYSW
jgi:hypothetical protein